MGTGRYVLSVVHIVVLILNLTGKFYGGKGEIVRLRGI